MERLWRLMNLVATSLTSEGVNLQAKRSKKKEWRERGISFMKRSQYQLAAFCFQHSKDEMWETQALANHYAEKGDFKNVRFSTKI